MDMVGKKVKLNDGKIGEIIKHIGENVYRLRLEDGFRTVTTDDNFEVLEDGRINKENSY